MKDNQIYVIGYPRSGNTWLSRLIGDALDSPVTGELNAVPIATEGLDRPGEYTVRQLHLRPERRPDDERFIPSAYEANLSRWRGQRLVHIIRNPLDVVVSVFYYWRRKTMDEALEAVGESLNPLRAYPPWHKFVDSWLRVDRIPVFHLRYEDLHADNVSMLMDLFMRMNIEVSKDRVGDAVNRQDINNKRKQIELDGRSRPYGTAIQLKALRKGVVGDWKNHLDRDQARRADGYFGEMMLKLGYIHDRDWWKEVQE